MTNSPQDGGEHILESPEPIEETLICELSVSEIVDALLPEKCWRPYTSPEISGRYNNMVAKELRKAEEESFKALKNMFTIMNDFEGGFIEARNYLRSIQKSLIKDFEGITYDWKYGKDAYEYSYIYEIQCVLGELETLILGYLWSWDSSKYSHLDIYGFPSTALDSYSLPEIVQQRELFKKGKVVDIDFSHSSFQVSEAIFSHRLTGVYKERLIDFFSRAIELLHKDFYEELSSNNILR